jgi:hypothetical protein
MKFNGQPEYYWMIQKRFKEGALKPGSHFSKWEINHKSKIYWTYQVAETAIKEYEKLGKKDSWFARFEYRIIRLEVIGVETIKNQLKSLENEKQLEITNSHKEEFIPGTTGSTKQSCFDTVFIRAFRCIQKMVSRIKSPWTIVNKG